MDYICFRLHSVDDYYTAVDRLAHEQIKFKTLTTGYGTSLLIHMLDAKKAVDILHAAGVQPSCMSEEYK